jgi:hypothetical protein
MSAYELNAERITILMDAYEVRASQEEFYLEETEEELRMILECAVTPAPSETPLTDQVTEIEDLITGDSDDPPLDEEQVEDMLHR